jgi:hypothetical protein
MQKQKRVNVHSAHILPKLINFPDNVGSFIKCRRDYQLESNEGGIGTRIEERLGQFESAYGKARQMIGDKPRLVYRLDLITEKMVRDNIHASKIGGVPDLGGTASLGRYRDNDTKKYNFPSVDEFVAFYWPRCPVCGRPMRFAAQINVWDWITVLHEITAVKGESSCRPQWESWRSGLGTSYSLFQYGVLGLAGKHLMVWHCVSSCTFGLFPVAQCQWANNSLAAFVRNNAHVEERTEVDISPTTKTLVASHVLDMFGEPFPWTIGEYIEAVGRFAQGETKTEIYSGQDAEKKLQHSCSIDHRPDDEGCYLSIMIEPQLIRDTNIGFDPIDLNYSFKDHPEDPLFDSDSDFVMFGEGQSQQEPRRPFCPNSFSGPHPMAAALTYSDPKEDLRHQVYSCLACGSGPYDGIGTPFPGILDCSGT